MRIFADQGQSAEAQQVRASARSDEDQRLPIIKLNEDVFTNQSESSMQQQMNVVAKKKNDMPFSVVFTDDGKFLINFDSEAAEAAFASMVDKVTDWEITTISNDLLYNIG